MSKDKSSKKDKKEKKEKRADADGVKKVKKDKRASPVEATTALLNHLEAQNPGTVAIDADGDVVIGDAEAITTDVPLVGALVPFANPLADEKQTKKILKAVKKASKQKALKRGTKEVIKAIKKSPTTAPSSTFSDSAGVCILAGDISPMDVISHFPVLCEDHNLPYMYVTSRQQLGESSNTKRPTSVVLVTKDRPKKKGEEDKEADAEWRETYVELVKLVEKATKGVKV